MKSKFKFFGALVLIPFAFITTACMKEKDPWENVESSPALQAPASLFNTDPNVTPIPIDKMNWDDLYMAAKNATAAREAEQAEEYWNECLNRTKDADPPDPRYLQCLNEYAYMNYMVGGKPEKALELFRLLSDTRARIAGETSPETITDRLKVANVLTFLRRFDEAEPEFRECLSILKENNDAPSKAAIVPVYDGYIDMLKKAGREDESKKISRESTKFR